MPEKRKPGWAFYATIILSLYFLSIFPVMWFETRYPSLMHAEPLNTIGTTIYSPIKFLISICEPFGRLLRWCHRLCRP